MPKQKLISNLDRTRWVSLSKIREFTIWEVWESGTPGLTMNPNKHWKVNAWLDKQDCFMCHEAHTKADAETWVEELNK